jgi:hypothetical protein
VPAVKAHIANSVDPLEEHSDIEAVCGTTVIHAEFLVMWEQRRIKPNLEDADWRGICRKCVAKELPHQHVYILVNGQELKHGEGSNG